MTIKEIKATLNKYGFGSVEVYNCSVKVYRDKQLLITILKGRYNLFMDGKKTTKKAFIQWLKSNQPKQLNLFRT